MAKRKSSKRKSRRGSRRRSMRGSFQKPLSLLTPAAIGAGGALAVNGLINYLPLPDQLKAGKMIYATRLGLAVALGVFGAKLPIIGKYASDMARGSMIVTMTDLGKELSLASGVNLSGTGYVGPAVIRSGARPGIARPNVARLSQYVNRTGPRPISMAQYVRR